LAARAVEQIVSFAAFSPLTPLLWLLIIRLVLEVCDRALRYLPVREGR
jgi:hypothetical protein